MGTRREHRSVLVCDGDLQTLRALRVVLGDAGLLMSATQTAEDALARAALRVPDAAIVEMALADSDGTEVVRRLREWSSMPLIILSNVTDEDRMVDAFRAGADDYIGKPFRPRELVARLNAHLRRATVSAKGPVVLCDGIQVDLAARVVRRHHHEIRLTPIEYKLLCVLVRDRGRLLTHDALLRDVWGAAYAEDRQTLRAHIANLRRKLSMRRSSGPIRTYPGVGYMFDNGGEAAAVHHASAAATAVSLRSVSAA